nr:hypothetical protein [Tanacetum cinerariifolium]
MQRLLNVTTVKVKDIWLAVLIANISNYAPDVILEAVQLEEQSFTWRSLKELFLLQKSSKLRMSKPKSVVRQMHQNRVFSSCFGLNILEEIAQGLHRETHVLDMIYYAIVSKSRAVIYRDKNDQKKMMREFEVHKFSDETLTRRQDKLDYMVKYYVLFKFNPGIEHRIWSEDDKRRSKDFIELDHMVKDFRLFKYNPGMTTRIWSEDDRRRSKEFMEVIEYRLKL